MKAEKFIASIPEKLVPPDRQQQVRELLQQRKRSGLRAFTQATSVVTWAYGANFAAAFNHYASSAQALVLVVSFAFAPHTAGLFALFSVLVALAFRDMYTHRKNVSPEAQYYLVTAGDAAVAGVFLLVSQGLAVIAAPSMALPAQALYRGLIVALPLISIIRMVLRPKPEELDGPQPLSDSPQIPAKKLYRTMRTLNFLWLMTFYGVILQGVTDKHNYLPDKLRGFLPLFTLNLWIAMQADDLCRRDNLVTLLTNLKERALRQMASRLPQGVKKTEVNYSSFIALQVFMFGLMVLQLFGSIEPFLLGQPLMQSIWHAIGGILAFAASVLSWKYVKAANRAAVRALIREADRIKAEEASHA